MNNNFLVGIEAIRPVCIKSEAGQDPEFIWIATHKDYNWFCGMGRNSISSINHLERLIDIVEGIKQGRNRDEQIYRMETAVLNEVLKEE